VRRWRDHACRRDIVACDAIGTGEIGLHFAIGKPLKGFCALMRGECSGPAKAHAAGPGSGTAVTCASED
jgi:hypothetical protein